jgi:hypothetical protein
MSFVQFCDDELWEVCSQKMRKIEVFSKFGEPLGTVEVSEQLIMPDAHCVRGSVFHPSR